MPPITLRDRQLGCALGAAVGDAFGMPLEFQPARPTDRLVRTMQAGRLPAGAFTDDTEMALALLDSLTAHRPLHAEDLARRFVEWLQAGPPDVGIQTARVLRQVKQGLSWQTASDALDRSQPDAAGNGSLMRAWPVALAYPEDMEAVLRDSALQSRVTHPNQTCQQACQLVTVLLVLLLRGVAPRLALDQALALVQPDEHIVAVVRAVPARSRAELRNTGWVLHTLESAVWGLLSTDSFSEAVIQVANLGQDADTAAAVTGALAGAAYGRQAIPADWLSALHGEWPLGSGQVLRAGELEQRVVRLMEEPL